MTTRQSNGSTSLPDAVNARVQRRLRHVRTLNNMEIGDLPHLSRSAVQRYELREASSIRLGDLYALADHYNLTFLEFIEILFSAEESNSEILKARALADSIESLEPTLRNVAYAMVSVLEKTSEE